MIFHSIYVAPENAVISYPLKLFVEENVGLVMQHFACIDGSHGRIIKP